MVAFLLRRAVASLIVFMGVTVVSFLLLRGAAGGYVPGLALVPGITAADVDRLRHLLGLDQPLPIQYLRWIGGIFTRGDFGVSLLDGSAVTSNVIGRLPATLELAGTALLIGTSGAVVLGVLGAVKRGSRWDSVITLLSVLGYAIPQFWLGLTLILALAVWPRYFGLPALPVAGLENLNDGTLPDRLAHLVLPATTLSVVYLSTWARFIRSSMITVLSEDYIRAARAKGMSASRVLFVHALRNAVTPLITLLGLELPVFVSGATIVEIVFDWPGVGLLAYQRAIEFDYPMVLGIVTLVAGFVIIGNLLADVAYSLVDPRIRVG